MVLREGGEELGGRVEVGDYEEDELGRKVRDGD